MIAVANIVCKLESSFRYSLVLLSSDLAEKLQELFLRHSVDRWMVVRRLVGGFVDLGNPALASALGRKMLLAGKSAPYVENRLDQIMRLVYKDHQSTRKMEAVDDKAMAMCKLFRELDNSSTKYKILNASSDELFQPHCDRSVSGGTSGPLWRSLTRATP